MFKMNRVKNIAAYAALILLGMLISVSMLSSRAAGELNDDVAPAPAPAQVDVRPASPGALPWAICTPADVAIYSERLHVKCTAEVGGIWYFAAPTSNAAHAARVLSLLSTAHAAGRTLDILYDPDDLSGAAIGCQTSDCRLIIAASFRQ
jgi:hypothetical protein